MAQGQIKKSSATKSSTSHAHHGNTSNKITRKGLGVKPSKKQSLIKRAKINKKFTSGLTAQTERMLGERAGHLEMLGQGRSKQKTTGAGAGEKFKGKKHDKK